MVRKLEPCFNFRYHHLLVLLFLHLLVVVIQQQHDQRCCCVRAQQLLYFPYAINYTRWSVSTNNIIHLYDYGYYSYFPFIPIFVRQSRLERPDDSPYAPSFALGFYPLRDFTEYNFYLAIILALTDQHGRLVQKVAEPHIVWSANRDTPVQNNSELTLTSAGELLLKHANGSLAWSSSTGGRSVVAMELRESGNLVLLDSQNSTLWQSFDHPTDTLLPGQTLQPSQSLIANRSITIRRFADRGIEIRRPYRGLENGTIHVSAMADDGFGAFAGFNPPLLYYRFPEGKFLNFLNITDKSLTFLAHNSGSPALYFLRLESDGHLKLYEWSMLSRRFHTTDVINPALGICGFPNICGRGGVCSNYSEYYSEEKASCTCSWPFGYSEKLPLYSLCMEYDSILSFRDVPVDKKEFLDVINIPSVNYYMNDAFLNRSSTTVNSCKQACLDNCSCLAALFRYESNDSNSQGSCYLLRELFSFINGSNYPPTSYNSVVYVVVEKYSYRYSLLERLLGWMQRSVKLTPIIGARLYLGVLLCIAVALYIKIKAYYRRKEGDIPRVPGTPTRFSYKHLAFITYNFARKLGSGGFGSVFSGILGDGTVVAVKLLQSAHQGKREFLAEVQTIGSIHHLNLVKLIGFCADKTHRLLVYEYMSNGSLDKWIFGDPKDRACSQQITWETSRKIIRDVANGLHYLHEECRQRIAHLDIKPQNILLDSNFNAKISDFGMAKLIDRDMSSVNTIMRGTPGYLAPEWLTSTVTEKADIYSFGVVIVEIVCRRRNIDCSQPEERMHLLALLRDKAMSGSLSEILAAASPDDVQHHRLEMEKMLKFAMWCLQSDVSKRPSMSTVLMVLDGTKEIPDDLEYDFTSMYRFDRRVAVDSGSPTSLLDSELSGPR